MGLDMYLEGEKFLTTYGESEPLMEDGFEIQTKVLRLGQWRKHPNLHGHIVATFAGGDDQCQRIELTVEDLRGIVEAVTAKNLPETSGFFFGASDGEEGERDLKILKAAIEWLEKKEEGVWRSVYYQASW